MQFLEVLAISVTLLLLVSCGEETSFTSTSVDSAAAEEAGATADENAEANELADDGDTPEIAAGQSGSEGSTPATDTDTDGSTVANETDTADSDNSLPPANKPGVKELIASCQDGKMTTAKHALSYTMRKDCSWGETKFEGGQKVEIPKNGNYSILNTYIRARETQSQSVDLPKGAIICGMNLKSQTKEIHFDDFFAMHVNNTVLAASKVLSNALVADEDGHKTWDWSKVLNKKMQNLGKYCATGNCLLPEHDKNGAFDISIAIETVEDVDKLNVQDKLNALLFAKLSGAEKLNFAVTATGDNDDDDCYHSGGEFMLEINYVTKK